MAKTNARKALQGTLRGDRMHPGVSAAVRLTAAPAAPASLSDDARPHWDVVAPLAVEVGTLTGADLPALAVLAETLATEQTLRAALSKEGVTITTGTTTKAHPALRALSDTRSQVIRMLAAFGLTPLGRMSVDTAPPPSGPHPLDALIRRK